MEELEEKIQAVLQDPEQMKQILSLAQSLGLSQLPDLAAGQSEQEPPTQEPTKETAAAQPPFPEPVTQLLRQAGKLEKRQENLLNALKPFLKPARREKIDRAMQVARLSHLAGYALRGREESKG